VKALLLTGSVGSGKTTVMLALGDLLTESGVPHALLDLDWLAWLRPAPGTLTVDQVLVANLAATWPTFVSAGAQVVVLTRAVQRAEQLAAIRAALPGVDLLSVRLEVTEPTRVARLRARDTGEELAEHLAFALDPLFEDVAIATGNRDPRSVALELYALVKPTGQDTPVPPIPQ
jgi:energy-coupling factor transporter ATP-binding protein EcfA2